MASLVLSGNTSGSITISSPSVSGTNTLTLPASTGTVLITNGSGIASVNGVQFPATQSASADANCLDDYEEGTWTPNQGGGLTVVGAFSSSGSYTKIGRQVTITGRVNGATSISVSSGGTILTNLPFVGDGLYFGALVNGATTTGTQCTAQTSTLYAVAAISTTTTLYFTVTYFV
jgi:hypothetical protein